MEGVTLYLHSQVDDFKLLFKVTFKVVILVLNSHDVVQSIGFDE